MELCHLPYGRTVTTSCVEPGRLLQPPNNIIKEIYVMEPRDCMQSINVKTEQECILIVRLNGTPGSIELAVARVEEGAGFVPTPYQPALDVNNTFEELVRDFISRRDRKGDKVVLVENPYGDPLLRAEQQQVILESLGIYVNISVN
jgi:hypothetical protein